MNASATALVVEDDPDLRNLMSSVLAGAGFQVHTAATGVAALEAAGTVNPDVITLDLNLPDTDGIILCRGLRNVTDAYIIILTARSEQDQVLLGLESGADDYMTKPFSSRELTARVKALLRRPRVRELPDDPTEDHHDHGQLVMRTSERTAHLNGTELALTRVEYDLLAALAGRPEQLITRQQLLDQVWASSWSDHHLVDVHVANLRRKLRPTRSDIEIVTVRGFGYRLHRHEVAESDTVGLGHLPTPGPGLTKS
ncbi:MAG: response regulator transcription factor [Propionibacteriales bacterium]|nr:response regulator transcription factor [Propionibacteriales bacterium]